MSVPTVRPRLFAANLGLLAIGEVTAKVFTLVAFAFLARTFGPGRFGQLEFALASVFMLTLVVDFGFGICGAREVAKDAGQVPRLVRNVVSSRAWFTLLAVVVLIGFIGAIRQPWDVKWLILLFGLSLLPSPFLLQWVFQGRDWMQYVVIAQVLRFGVFASIVLMTVRKVGDLWWVPVAELAGVSACAGFTIAVYRWRFGSLRPVVPSIPDRRFVLASLPVGLSQLMWAVRYVFVIVLLGLIATAEDVGRFSAAVRIILAVHTFVALYFYNLLPTVSRCSKESPDTLRRLLAGLIRISSWASVLMCVVGVVMAEVVIRLIYGPAYGESVIVLRILLGMLALAIFSSHYRVTLIAYARQGLEMTATSLGTVVQIGLVLLGYGRFGLAGVACAMLIGELVTLLLAWWFVQRQVATIRIWPALKAPGATAVILGLAVYALVGQPWWLTTGLVVALFGIMLILWDRRFMGDVAAVILADRVSDGNARL